MYNLDMQANIKNRTIFCRDNLDVLRGINGDSVDLIYLDPPFNKKKEFAAPMGSSAEGASFSDIFRQKDVKEEWLQEIAEDHFAIHELLHAVKSIEGRASYNFCYLAYMAIRLMECHRILKPTGSIYLHCDPTMSHHLKLLLDCVFGEDNFQNEIIWYYSGGGASRHRWARKHDVILFYTGGGKWTFNTDAVRTAHKWTSGQKRADGSSRSYSKGKLADDVYSHHALMPWAKERTGYPTQKPLALLERIIAASSKKGDTVLDPFCGCATTCVAAEKLGRKWAGIDISVKAYELVKKRLAKEVEREKTLFYEELVTFATTPPKRADQGAGAQSQKFVYVISHEKYPGEYKVGIAKDAKARLNSYQTADPNRAYDLKFCLLTPHFRQIERHIHAVFDNKHEWVRGDLAEIKKAIKNWKPK